MFAAFGAAYDPGRLMESHGPQSTGECRTYRIVVRSELGERFAAAFEGMEVTSTEGQTIISGRVVDQSHLHGILDRVGALGLDLVSVEPVCDVAQDE
jgi:hypothetical protein